jgi:hypothetical protein
MICVSQKTDDMIGTSDSTRKPALNTRASSGKRRVQNLPRWSAANVIHPTSARVPLVSSGLSGFPNIRFALSNN